MSHISLWARHTFTRLHRPSITPRTARPSTVRHASTAALRPSIAKPILYTTALSATLALAYLYTTDTRASVHTHLVPRLIRLLYPDAEDAHHFGTKILKTLYSLNLHPRERPSGSTTGLATIVFSTPLANPIGISAGLDKDAEIPDALFALGAGVVEVGGCTPRPQAGNPKPRVWRVPALDGLINRYGLNSIGADALAARLRTRLRSWARANGYTEEEVLTGDAGVSVGSLSPGRMLAVQIAKGKETAEGDVDAVVRDYVFCVERVGRYADVIVVNVSSPNTPGLRDLQAAAPLGRILSAVVGEAGRVGKAAGRRERPKVMVKVSPDEDEEAQMEGIVKAVWDSGVDGLIVGNTTKRRGPALNPKGVRLSRKEEAALTETGGYSGPAMFERTLDLVGRYRKMLDGQGRGARAEENAAAVPAVSGIATGSLSAGKPEEQKVIFATGGITNGEQALKVLNAGASIAMIYTGMVYGGAGTVTRIKTEMRESVQKQ